LKLFASRSNLFTVLAFLIVTLLFTDELVTIFDHLVLEKSSNMQTKESHYHNGQLFVMFRTLLHPAAWKMLLLRWWNYKSALSLYFFFVICIPPFWCVLCASDKYFSATV